MTWNPFGRPAQKSAFDESVERVGEGIDKLIEDRRKLLEEKDAFVQQVAKLLDEAVAIRQQLANANKTIAGLEHRFKVSRRAFETLELGADVVISGGPVEGSAGIRGRVSGIFIDRGGASYWVVWWQDGRRFEERLDSCEVAPAGDELKLPGENPEIQERS